MTAKPDREKAKAPAALRASVSFHPDLYHTLEEIAKQKKVSLAWVVREAAEYYVANQSPLYGRELAEHNKRQAKR